MSGGDNIPGEYCPGGTSGGRPTLGHRDTPMHYLSTRDVASTMAQITSAEDVASEVGLEADELTKPCDSKIIPSLADCFIQWRVIFASLLSTLDIGDVDRENQNEEERRIAALHKWKARNGNAATYEILVDALLSRGEKDQAESLCKKVLTGVVNARNSKLASYSYYNECTEV